MPITTQQREEILALIREGGLSTAEIAERVGVAAGSVAAVKAWLAMGKYPDLVEASSEELLEASDTVFELEKDMQAALRGEVGQLEPGLVVVDGGSERHVKVGFIDITARDASGTTVVVELKAGTAAPQALTQTLAYMANVKDEEGGRDVRGILVAADFHPKVVEAVKVVPSVLLRRYRYRFTFEAP
jgi:RecB family endonuclease NucS